MSSLRMCLSLLYAASFLLSGASSDQVVSLRCNQTVEVEVGETAILNCSILYGDWEANCRGLHYFWHDTNSTDGPIPCKKKHKCEWDAQTYVSLTISNVTKEETYTIEIVMDCGMAESSIKVQIKSSTHTHGGTEQDPVYTSPHVVPTVLSIFAALLVSGILYFLFRNGRGRKMIKCIKKEKTHGHSSCKDTAGEGENSDCLTNLEVPV